MEYTELNIHFNLTTKSRIFSHVSHIKRASLDPRRYVWLRTTVLGVVKKFDLALDEMIVYKFRQYTSFADVEISNSDVANGTVQY
jgi:hypothetical protein